MSDRDLTTTRRQVFGDVSKGTECRICGRPVGDGRSKTCSDYCDNIQTAVMGMLNWSSVRRRIIKRDDETCQNCGFDYSKEKLARAHIRALVEERAGERPENPGMLARVNGEDDDFDWDAYHQRHEEWRERREEIRDCYGYLSEHETALEVDHIVPIAEGGHPFDPANLQTLCEDCHRDKTAQENSERGQTPGRGDLSESLFEYVSSDQGVPTDAE